MVMIPIKCEICGGNTVPYWGPTSTGILLIGEFPGWQELRDGRPWVGEAGLVLRQELAKVGIQLQRVRSGNIWQHDPPEKKDPLYNAELDYHFELTRKELKDAKYVLLMGSDVARVFYGKLVTSISGLNIRSPVFPSCVKGSIIIPNPASALIPSGVIGEIRLGIQRFGEMVEGIL